MLEVITHEQLVEKLYGILDTLNHDIETQKQRHQQEVDALVKCLQQKQSEIAHLRSLVKERNILPIVNSIKNQKATMPMSAVFSRKKSTQEKPSLQVHLNNNLIKNEWKLIKGVDMVSSISGKKPREQSGLKKSQTQRSTSRKKSADYKKIGEQRVKNQGVDTKCYVVKKKVDIENKENIMSVNAKNTASYKSPTNKNSLLGFSTNKKQGLKLKDCKQNHHNQSSCKQKEDHIHKSQSRRQISVYIPIKKSKQVASKKSLQFKE